MLAFGFSGYRFYGAYFFAETAAYALIGDLVSDKGCADSRRTLLIVNVGFVLVPEVAQRRRIGFGAVCPRAQRAPALIDLASFSSFSMSPSCPLPSVMAVSISSMRFVPSRQGVHLPQDSDCVKLRKNLATSTIQVSSSMTTSPPDPIIAPAAISES